MRRGYGALGLALALLASACASTGTPPAAGSAVANASNTSGTGSTGGNPRDPWEGFNRAMFSFNDAIDGALLQPAAKAYAQVLPAPLRSGVGNVFGTVEDLWSAVNHVLQGKPADGLQMGMRVATNLTFGLGGLLDPATELGLERKSEDFGQTLGRWGIGSGPYVVLPLLGPRTLRDSGTLPIDNWASLSRQAEVSELNRRRITLVNVVHTRAELLGATRILGDIALDKYSFTRDAYLQRRRNQVYDGDPPDEPANEAAERFDKPEPVRPGATGAGTPSPK